MNEKQIGPFIKMLREEKKLNQEQLAEILCVHRTTVNKWENGNSIPLNDTLVLLSEFFDVSIDEILAGTRFKKEEVDEKNNEVLLSLLSKRRKLIKIIIYIGSLLFIITSVFLTYYFFTTYNTLHVYTVYVDGENYNNSTGLLVLSRDKNYLKMGTFYNKTNKIVDVDKIDFYYKEEENINILYSGSIRNLVVDFSRNIHKISIKDLNNDKYDFYLKIYYDGNSEELKLNIKKDFNNDALLYDEKNVLTADSLSKVILDNIKNNDKFIYDKNYHIYTLIDKNIKIECFEDLNSCHFVYSDKNIEYYYIYDLMDNSLEYRKTNETKIIECYTLNINDFKEKKEKEIYNGFYRNIIDKYLN